MDPYVGEIKLMPWGFAPRGWHLCDGSLLPISSFQALFSLLGTQYGGNGTTNFALPDLRGRAPVSFGATYPQGAVAGTEMVTLALGQMPIHGHALMGSSSNGDVVLPATGHAYATISNTADPHYAPDTTTTSLNPASIQNAGSGQAHDNMQPFLVMNYCIALNGVYPSRN